MTNKSTYLEDLDYTILHYRVKASESRILGPVYSFMASAMENTAMVERKHHDLRARRKRIGWLGYMKSIFIDSWLNQLRK